MDFYEKIKELVEMMQNFDLAEIEVKDGEKEIKLKKRGENSGNDVPIAPQIVQSVPVMASQQATSTPSSDQQPVPTKDPKMHEFNSPIVGTFYTAPSPESAPYVTEGDKVKKDSILCIIEAMKVMNEIKAELSGEIIEVLVENGEADEYGQPLFLIRTSD